jgi:mannose-6-phosphate isomerase
MTPPDRPRASAPAVHPLRPEPMASVRPWAGARLGPAADSVGELWLAGPDSMVETGAGRETLDQLAARSREVLVGTRGMALLGARFPLLVKLIDAAEWLSLQVHPDDALARELYGPDAVGKAEAWLVVAADDGAEFVTGPSADLGPDELRARIAAGSLGRDGCAVGPAVPGDTLLLRTGTMHAIGAGCFIYEIEQPSDITFRMSDWGRPETPTRRLHRAESLRAVDPLAHAVPVGHGWCLDGGALVVPQFRLELLADGDPVTRRPAGTSPEVVTPVAGEVVAEGDGWTERLLRNETLVIPAAVARYRLRPSSDALVCIGTLP